MDLTIGHNWVILSLFHHSKQDNKSTFYRVLLYMYIERVHNFCIIILHRSSSMVTSSRLKKTIKKTLKVRFSWTFCFLLLWSLLLWGRIFNTQSLTLQYTRRRIKCRSWYPQIFKELQVEPKLGAWPTYEYVSSFTKRFCRRQRLRIAQTWNYWKVAGKLQYFF